jgi:hypothetical protein
VPWSETLPQFSLAGTLLTVLLLFFAAFGEPFLGRRTFAWLSRRRDTDVNALVRVHAVTMGVHALWGVLAVVVLSTSPNLRATDFGSAQLRKRAIIIGTHRDLDKIEVPRTRKPVDEWRTLRDVLGYVRPAINFEIRLPLADEWNGKFYMAGCGGLCGMVDAAPVVGRFQFTIPARISVRKSFQTFSIAPVALIARRSSSAAPWRSCGWASSRT